MSTISWEKKSSHSKTTIWILQVWILEFWESANVEKKGLKLSFLIPRPLVIAFHYTCVSQNCLIIRITGVYVGGGGRAIGFKWRFPSPFPEESDAEGLEGGGRLQWFFWSNPVWKLKCRFSDCNVGRNRHVQVVHSMHTKYKFLGSALWDFDSFNNFSKFFWYRWSEQLL